MPFGLGVTELVIILVIVLILFGPKKLPQIGESIGKALRSFKDSQETDKDTTPKDETVKAAEPKKEE